MNQTFVVVIAVAIGMILVITLMLSMRERGQEPLPRVETLSERPDVEEVIEKELPEGSQGSLLPPEIELFVSEGVAEEEELPPLPTRTVREGETFAQITAEVLRDYRIYPEEFRRANEDVLRDNFERACGGLPESYLTR